LDKWDSLQEIEDFLSDGKQEDYLGENPHVQVYVSDFNLKLLGYGQLSQSGLHPNLSRLYIRVLPNYRNSGIGTLIAKKILRICNRSVADVLLYEGNTVGISFLKKNGFDKIQTVTDFSVNISHLKTTHITLGYSISQLSKSDDIFKFVADSYTYKHKWIGKTNFQLDDLDDIFEDCFYNGSFFISYNEAIVAVVFLYADESLIEAYIFESEDKAHLESKILQLILSTIKDIAQSININHLIIEVDNSNVRLYKLLQCTTDIQTHFLRYRKKL